MRVITGRCGFLCVLLIYITVRSTLGYVPRSCTTVTSSRLPEPTQQNARLQGHVFTRTEVAGTYWCARRCLQQHKCLSFNYHQDLHVCQLNSATVNSSGEPLAFAPGVLYYERHGIPEYIIGSCEGHSCHPDSVCTPVDHEHFTCDCQNPALSGNNCSATVVDNTCDSNPCAFGGSCHETSEGFECLCTPGYTGDTCDFVICLSYSNSSIRVSVATQMVSVSWRNDVEDAVDVYMVLPDQLITSHHQQEIPLQERWQFSVPAAAQRKWNAYVDTLWVARDRQSHQLLPVDKGCSFIVPNEEGTVTVITAN